MYLLQKFLNNNPETFRICFGDHLETFCNQFFELGLSNLFKAF